jgi:peptide/nickel transport system permease protein
VRAVVTRLVWAALTFVAVAALTFLTPRLLRPDFYPGQGIASGVANDLERLLLHFDLGRAWLWPGSPEISGMLARNYAADLWLLGGAMVIGVGGGVAGGLWCASRRRSVVSRVLEASAMVLYCTPVYVVGLLLLLAFNPIFGTWPLPAFFEAEPIWASPWSEPWDWFRTLLVPWLVLAAPLGAMVLRLTLATAIETLDEDYVRTAYAKGLGPRTVMRRHAAPASYVTTASFLAVSIPLIVTNMVLVERVLSVPGFFRFTWKALGHVEPIDRSIHARDFPMLQALTLWGAVLIIVASVVLDAVVHRLDPRIGRTASD